VSPSKYRRGHGKSSCALLAVKYPAAVQREEQQKEQQGAKGDSKKRSGRSVEVD